MAWETKGVRSVKSAIKIKGDTNFKNSAKDALITTQLRTALILIKDTKATNYKIDTINGKTYIFGIAMKKKKRKKLYQKQRNLWSKRSYTKYYFS